MSMWLSKKKKADLVDLCDEVGLRTDGLKKPEIEQNLKQHLYQHESKLSTHPSFASYYETLARSPNKRGSPPVFINPVDPILPEGAKRERRQSMRFQPGVKSTRGYSESVEPEPSTAVFTTHINGIPEDDISSELEYDPQPRRRTGSTTPAPTRRSARVILNNLQSPSAQLIAQPETPTQHTVPLPPSPSVVADLVEASTDNIRARISTYLNEHLTLAITRRVQSTQQSLSNVISVAVLVHAVELGMLVYKLIPASYPVTIPPVIGNPSTITVNLPDLFTVLEGRFWAPVLTWVIVSVLVPGLVGYFVNLTRSPAARKASGGYVCDPLTFALAKGLVGWMLFYRRIVNSEGLKVVEEAIGKEVLVLVGSMIVGLVGLWEGLMTR